MDNPIEVMPFAKALGIRVTQADKTTIRAEMAVRADLCTTGGIAHGGALMAFADSVGALAAFMNLPEGAGGTTTIESKTNFLAAAPEGATLRSETTPLQVGRRLSVWQTKITRDDGRTVVVVTQSQLVL